VIKVGLVGYGFAGRGFHAYLIGLVPELQLVAVGTRDPGRRQQAEDDHGVTTYVTLDEMLAQGDVDLVVVATPHDTHKNLACQAMDAGKHVVVDKVMCLNTAEADAMLAARDRNSVLLSVFQNRRWDGDYLTVRRALDAGWLGAPFLFESAVLSYRPPRGWRGDAGSGGGVLFDWGAHLIDQALQLVPGPVASVTCDIQYRGWGARIGSYARLLLRFANGTLFSVEVGNLVRAETPRWRVVGERGALVKDGLDPQERAMLAGDIAAAVEGLAHRARITTDFDGLATELVVEGVRGDWPAYYRNVAAALTGTAALAVTPEEARRGLLIFDAAMTSARTGETVRLAEEG
jgi:scyllo-inositol 2-dehydrogenase (NADP+)